MGTFRTMRFYLDSTLITATKMIASGMTKRSCARKRLVRYLSFSVCLVFATCLLAQPAAGGDYTSPAMQSSLATNLGELQRLFVDPPADSRIMMRWWWFGPAVTKPELEREMKMMKESGIGGFEVQPVYPLAPDDQKTLRTLPFLSDEFLDALRFTSAKSRELGLRMDLTLGSGWPYGGPQVPVTQAAGMLRWERVKVDTSSRRVPLPDISSG